MNEGVSNELAGRFEWRVAFQQRGAADRDYLLRQQVINLKSWIVTLAKSYGHFYGFFSGVDRLQRWIDTDLYARVLVSEVNDAWD